MASSVTDRATVQSVSLEVIAENGFHGASMREIARRVGTSLSNLYNYYPSKASLLCDVLDSGSEALHSAMVLSRSTDAGWRDGMETSSPPGVTALDGQRLVLGIVRAATEYSLSNPVMMRMALTEARYLEGEYRETVDAGQRKCIAVLRDAMTEHFGDGLPAGFDPHFTARSIMLLTSHLPVWMRVNTDAEQEKLTAQHLEACARLMGICKPAYMA